MYSIIFPEINPVLLSIGNIEIRWYGISYALGIIIAYYLVNRMNSKSNILNKEALDSLMLYSSLGIIIGGRLGYVIFYNPEWIIYEPLRIIKTWEGGMSFHGGLIGMVIAIYVLCYKHNISTLATYDLLSCVAPIGLLFGRIANFINGELYGKITNVEWGVIFPNTDGMPRHPSQLYEAFAEGILMLCLLLPLYQINSIRDRKGTISGLFLIAYSTIRITIEEKFREPDYMINIDILKQQFSIGQALSLPMFLVGICLIWKALKYDKNAH